MEENQEVQNNQEFQQINSEKSPMDGLRRRPDFSKPNSAPYIPQEKKKSKTPIIILLTIFFVILAGCGGFYLGNVLMKEKPSCPTCENKNNSTGETTKSSTPEEYAEVSSILKEILNDSQFSKEDRYSSNEYIPMYKPEGLNTFIQMRFALSRTYRDKVETRETAIENQLLQLGFEKYGEIPQSLDHNAIGFIDKNRNIFCAVNQDAEYYPAHPTTPTPTIAIACAHTNWTWLTDEEFELAKGLETAVYNKTGEYPPFVYFDISSITNSKIAPYQTINASVTNGISLFYRTSPDSEWQYFTSIQDMASCEEYNTEDLKKAYLGERCYINDAESTVQL